MVNVILDIVTSNDGMLLNTSRSLRPPSQLLLQVIKPSGLLHLYRPGSALLLTWVPTARYLYNQRNPRHFARELSSRNRLIFGGSHLRARASHFSSPACFQSSQRSVAATMSPPDRDVLPNTVKPINYNINLFGLELGGGFAFHGAVTIEIDIRTAVQEITLNAHELEINSATIDGKDAQSMSQRTPVHLILLTLFSGEDLVRQGVPAGHPEPSREGRPFEGESVHQIQRYHEQHYEWLLQIQV